MVNKAVGEEWMWMKRMPSARAAQDLLACVGRQKGVCRAPPTRLSLRVGRCGVSKSILVPTTYGFAPSPIEVGRRRRLEPGVVSSHSRP